MVSTQHRYQQQMDEIKAKVQQMLSEPTSDEYTLEVQMITLESYLRDLVSLAQYDKAMDIIRMHFQDDLFKLNKQEAIS